MLWKLSVKCWAELGFGSTIALVAAALSENRNIWFMSGISVIRFSAIVAALAMAAISASNTSACPPRPILVVPTSFPRW